jgi:hypothetical protein
VLAHNAGAELTGRIIDEEGQPVSNAEVSLPEENLSESTNDNGNFSLSTTSPVIDVTERDVGQSFSISAAKNALLINNKAGTRHFSVTIRDMRGRTVSRPVNAILPSGTHSFSVMTDQQAKLPASAYVLTVQSGSYTFSRTITALDHFSVNNSSSQQANNNRTFQGKQLKAAGTLNIEKSGFRSLSIVLEELGGETGDLVITESSGFPRLAMKTGDDLMSVIYEPDPSNGYYRSTRFDYSSMIKSVKCGSHTFFSEWKTPHDPNDNEGGNGIAEEFNINTDPGTPPPPGFDEAGEGQSFVKIGVGALVKSGGSYQFSGNYQISNPGTWTVKRGINWIEFVHELDDVNGYGYVYTKRYVFDKEESTVNIEKNLENTGSKSILAEQYAHNFITIDGAGIGPNYSVEFGWNLSGSVSNTQFSGSTINISSNLDASIYGQLGGYSGTAEENSITVTNSSSGGTVSITGSEPVGRCAFFATPGVICPEIFVTINVGAGETKSWSSVYEFGKI